MLVFLRSGAGGERPAAEGEGRWGPGEADGPQCRPGQRRGRRGRRGEGLERGGPPAAHQSCQSIPCWNQCQVDMMCSGTVLSVGHHHDTAETTKTVLSFGCDTIIKELAEKPPVFICCQLSQLEIHVKLEWGEILIWEKWPKPSTVLWWNIVQLCYLCLVCCSMSPKTEAEVMRFFFFCLCIWKLVKDE